MRQEFRLVREVGVIRVRRVGSGALPAELVGSYTTSGLAAKAVNDFVDGCYERVEHLKRRKERAAAKRIERNLINRDKKRAMRAEAKKNAENQAVS